MFTDSELEFLRDLRGDPRWDSILTKLKSDHSTRWKAGKTAEEWANSSGRLDENDRILSLLTGGK